ncbi:hypothetical protein PR202_gb09854 [Eleusine coracana subsp. coracana]|uniref:Uncharacterized protein n=1 Tax=Eleusine coracana subsp. coracana TaxID=191504 RepID=A0AAV5EGM8_ELECO|nr:hypothetical protein PR202_gb09854 [Eleusine coracana subsp. coracana]
MLQTVRHDSLDEALVNGAFSKTAKTFFVILPFALTSRPPSPRSPPPPQLPSLHLHALPPTASSVLVASPPARETLAQIPSSRHRITLRSTPASSARIHPCVSGYHSSSCCSPRRWQPRPRRPSRREWCTGCPMRRGCRRALVWRGGRGAAAKEYFRTLVRSDLQRQKRRVGGKYQLLSLSKGGQNLHTRQRLRLVRRIPLLPSDLKCLTLFLCSNSL